MKPREAAKWVEAQDYCQRNRSVPAVLAAIAAKKYKPALAALMDKKPAIRFPRGVKAKVKRVSLPKLKKELDRVFSLFIRQRDSDPHTGLGKCATCDYVAHWKEMDCGHYQPRQDMNTRWDERNCHLQDKSCNGFRGGEAEKMAAYIDAKYEPGTAECLREQSGYSFKPTRQWLEAKITHYKGLIHE